jgi:hypothetical protein
MNRSDLGLPVGPDAPWLRAILGRLDDIHTLLEKLVQPPKGEVTFEMTELRKVQEPAPEIVPDIAEQPADDNPPPPRAGRGASVEAWLGWAQQHGVPVEAGMTRADIIAACTKAGALADN